MAVVALATTSAKAEAVVRVPFSFTVEGKNLPAGQYIVDRDSYHNLVTLKSRGSSESFTWLLNPGDPDPKASNVVLHFGAQGQIHALQSIQYESLTTRRLDKTKAAEHAYGRISQGQ
jgi:hypothetical protein